MEILHFIFSGFWVFIGICILLNIILDGFYQIIKSILNRQIIKKYGYPPENFNIDHYCDTNQND
jgi:hypothetical protein